MRGCALVESGPRFKFCSVARIICTLELEFLVSVFVETENQLAPFPINV